MTKGGGLGRLAAGQAAGSAGAVPALRPLCRSRGCFEPKGILNPRTRALRSRSLPVPWPRGAGELPPKVGYAVAASPVGCQREDPIRGDTARGRFARVCVIGVMSLTIATQRCLPGVLKMFCKELRVYHK